MRIWRSTKLFFLSHWRGLLILLFIILGFYVTLNAGFTVVSSNEGTCLSCHVMNPYHRSWEKSSHSGVSCVSCHELEFGYFTSALAKTATGLYNPKLLANVDNKTCLQSQCHQLEVVERSSGFGKNVAFDHKNHLTQMRRGERLRCTSCHTSDPTGESHFVTDKNTCFICHFKGAEEGKSVTGCATCHTETPEHVEHGGFSFNHNSYLKLGVSCEECHVKITRGTAAVPQNTCNKCHDERLEKFNDFEVMHDKHVTTEGISCFRCHGEIEHSALDFVATLNVNCDSCHAQMHSPQKQMYMGVNGQGLSDVPSRMFAAKVTCEGCHTEKAANNSSQLSHLQVLTQRREACVRCHEAGYDDMLDDWIREIQTTLDYVAPYERRAQATLATITPEDEANKEVAEFLRDALTNISLVRQGEGIHNVEYAVKLINSSIDQIDLAFKRYKQPLTFASRPLVLQQPDGYCNALCHSRLNIHGVEFVDEMQLDFDHDSHTHVSCTTCHSATKHKERVISKDGCMTCHHTEEAQEDYGVGCEDCHSQETDLYQGLAKVAGVEIEADIMAQSDTACLDCHKIQAQTENLNDILGRCNTCHVDYGIEPENVNQWFVENEISSRQKSDRLIVRIANLRNTLRTLGRRGATREISEAIDEAERDLNVVLTGRAHHNFAAAHLILAKVEKSLADIDKLLLGE